MGVFTDGIFAVVHLLIDRGFLYTVAYLRTYVYLKFTKIFSGRRFDLYDFDADDEPEKLSFFVPQEEYKLELPQNSYHLEKKADSVFFMGVNSHDEILTVQISRKRNSTVWCSLMLHLSDGRTYTLPEEHSIQQEVEEVHTFGSARLKLQCLSPMRRWRVFFNGILREISSNRISEEKFKHVRFSFLWVASSDVFDYASDMTPAVLSDAVATNASYRWPPSVLLPRMKRIFNRYEQCGMLLGTVTLEGEVEKEMYLWGCRGHFMGYTTRMREADFEDIYVNSENGTFIHLGVLNISGMIRNFTYGFVMQANGYIFPIEKCVVLDEDTAESTKKLRCFAGEKEYTVSVSREGRRLVFPKEYDGISFVTQSKARLNVMEGRGLIYEGKIQPQSGTPEKEQIFPPKNSIKRTQIPLLSVPFEDSQCQLVSLCGGKGSSLAKLSGISEELNSFIVPKGIVVTTEAYESFMHEDAINFVQILEKAAGKMSTETIKTQCERLVAKVRKIELSEGVKSSIKENLLKIFGEHLGSQKFAVRSSATGEDTEQMSAAGQMETFLGCKGLEEIFEAVKKCWSSQFSHTAVEYKRRYGQPLNTPMAVVIQQMIPCDAAGVIFTCDPVTGNPSYITITANYGLGESVVAASADPDTVTLEKDVHSGIRFHSQSAGQKKTKIVMDESGGTREIHVEEDESNEYCISRETAYLLGEIAATIEDIFGNPRDIEWGVLDGNVYLFQSRPVTSLDTETDFETKHSIDSHIRCEAEYISAGVAGEVLSGATSPLGVSLLVKNFEMSGHKMKCVKLDGDVLPDTPYITKRFLVALNRVFLSFSDGIFRHSGKDEDELPDHIKALSVALFGRLIEDRKIFAMARDRHENTKQTRPSLLGKLYMLLLMFFAGRFCKKTNRHINRFYVPIKKSSSSAEILHSIAINFHEMNDPINKHTNCSFSSTFWNIMMLNFLKKARGAWDNETFSDFGYLLSNCSQVESADVPSAIQKLGFTISKCKLPEGFKEMDAEDALSWFQTSSSKAGSEFREFLNNHGHRCLKEFDIYSVRWAEDPKLLVKMLQSMVGTDIKEPAKHDSMSFGEILSQLHVRLGFIDRMKLKLLLPNCRRAIREREFSKSTVIMGWYRIRQTLCKLADALVEEGRLPNPELLFFLEVEEIRQLIEKRSPRLVAKAFRRWKVRPELDNLIFPEIMSGIPKPVSMDEERIISANGFTMTGIPVSQGVVKGTARVILKLEDANIIQPGDILITHATDIGWSPYFALLSGVATEIGGLISHGAVVAREYGLPCVVNLQGASRAFTSGDQVLLDGNRGILQKIENI